MLIGPPGALSPVAWGARINYDAWDDRWIPKDKYAVHYGGGRNSAGDPVADPSEQVAREMKVLRAWERFHIDTRGWRGIAYNWSVGQSGTIYRLRGWNLNGAHYGSDDIDYDGIPANYESVAVVFILGGDQEPTSKAYAGFERLENWVNLQVGGNLPLFGHQEIAASGGHSTSCPGDWLMAYVEASRIMSTFGDVPETYWAHDEIEWLADTGVTQGYSDGTFRPNNNVTRAQMAVFLYRFAQYLENTKSG